jgi:predicted AlkP superfamily pyrophosphatase or phosphodiesterase
MYASGVRNTLPAVTYPDHTTLITGVWPSRHGIPNNRTFDPMQLNMSGWYWYSSDIKVRTLWDAVHEKGGVVASLSWPVSVDAKSIDYNVPEFRRTGNDDDLKLLKALSTPAIADMLAKRDLSFDQIDGGTVETDTQRARFTADLIREKHPAFTTVHLRALDHYEHLYGPGTAEANRTLEALDAAVGQLVSEARKAEPGLVVALVSDHGFSKVDHDVNLIGPFIEDGLITMDGKKVKSWKAEPWGDSSLAVVLADPGDVAVKAKVKGLLDRLAANPQLGISQVADAGEIAQMGGTPMASFWIDLKPGYEMTQNPFAPSVGPGSLKGAHGYFPTDPEMRATFILAGPGIAKKQLGDIDMRDIAPTLAKVMNVSLPDADGKPLF